MGYKRGNKRPVNSFGIRTNCNTQKEFIEIFFYKGTNETNGPHDKLASQFRNLVEDEEK